MLECDKLSSKAQTSEGLLKFRALNDFSMFEVAMPLVRYQRWNDTKQKENLWQAKACL